MSTEIDALFHELLEEEGRISDDEMYKHMRIYVECIHDIALRLENLQKDREWGGNAGNGKTHEALTQLHTELLDLVTTGHQILDKWMAG